LVETQLSTRQCAEQNLLHGSRGVPRARNKLFGALSRRGTKIDTIKSIIKKKKPKTPVFAKYEFQAFGLYLAGQLGDLKHKALYIKLAKEEERSLLRTALEFVKARTPKSRAKLFMWKLSDLKKAK